MSHLKLLPLVALLLAGLPTLGAATPLCPAQVTRLPLGAPRDIEDLEIVGDQAYTVDAFGLSRWDLANPEAPVYLGSWPEDRSNPWQWYALEVAGDVAYVDTPYGGTGLLDLADPSAPRLRGVQSFHSPLVAGPFLVDAGWAIDVYDISEPRDPVLICHDCVDESTIKELIVAVDDGYLYVASFFRLSIYRLRLDGPPELVGQAPHPFSMIGARGLEVDGGLAVVQYPSSPGALVPVDVSDPTQPQFHAKITTDGDVALLHGGILYATSYSSLLRWDLSDPSAPRQLATYSDPSYRWLNDVEAAGELVYLATQQGLEVLRPGAEAELVGTSQLTGHFSDLVVEGGVAALPHGRGVHFVDLRDPARATPMGELRLDTDGRSLNVQVAGANGSFVVRTGSEVLVVALCADSGQAQVRERFPAGLPYVYAVDADAAGLVVASCSEDGNQVDVYTWSEGGSAVHRAALPLPTGCLTDLLLAGSRLYAVSSRDWYVVDLSVPAAPALVSSMALSSPGTSYPHGLHLIGELLAISYGSTIPEVYDVADPSQPVAATLEPRLLRWARSLKVQGELAWAIDEYDYPFVADIASLPEMPYRPYDGPSNSKSGTFVGDRLLVAADPYLEIVELRCGPPVADFSWLQVGRDVLFLARTTYAASFWGTHWDFGDGETSVGRTAHHRYAQPGTYLVTLSLSGPDGEDRQTRVVCVSDTTEVDVVRSPGGRVGP